VFWDGQVFHVSKTSPGQAAVDIIIFVVVMHTAKVVPNLVGGGPQALCRYHGGGGILAGKKRRRGAQAAFRVNHGGDELDYVKARLREG
jgi:hypothetical protein